MEKRGGRGKVEEFSSVREFFSVFFSLSPLDGAFLLDRPCRFLAKAPLVLAPISLLNALLCFTCYGITIELGGSADREQ